VLPSLWRTAGAKSWLTSITRRSLAGASAELLTKDEAQLAALTGVIITRRASTVYRGSFTICVDHIATAPDSGILGRLIWRGLSQ
jgi:hypothetical protein